jgi:hypothetical protein
MVKSICPISGKQTICRVELWLTHMIVRLDFLQGSIVALVHKFGEPDKRTPPLELVAVVQGVVVVWARC